MQHQFLNTSKVLQERGIQGIRAPSQTSQLGLNLRHVCLGVSHTLSGCFWVGGGSSRMLEMGQQLHSLQLFWPETLRNLTLFPIQFGKSWMLLRNKHNNLTRNGCFFSVLWFLAFTFNLKWSKDTQRRDQFSMSLEAIKHKTYFMYPRYGNFTRTNQ